ncbi:hypothetical protein [Lactobacillus sp. PV034]|uniref:hypothetical protein n=1 Tax=Lactobacillus sp. PV034 TaxID=2594495 RepID=UPI00223F97BE|nr:hypothetical protein [Lactobacillus sp. PV034]QNQ81053.1 hypothetical protein FP432_05530 [Lactobacillus sp. PV034]
MLLLYILIDIYIVGYLFYSWYWQAVIELKAHYRIASLFWTLVFLVIFFSMDYLSNPTLGLNAIIAAFILMSIVDGFSGFAKNRLVVSGYFKRTVKYSEIERVTLIPLPTSRKPTTMVIFQTHKRTAFTLRFSQGLEVILVAIQRYIGKETPIEIRKLI